MKYPEFLKPGGCIGFVAPSFGAFSEPYHTCFNRSLEIFKDMGYKTVLGLNVYKGDGIGISTNPKDCGRELTDAYISKESDILISVGGGELMCETMSHVDLEEMKKADPKWYMGYSDNTNFSFLQATVLATVSLYGPCASDFSMEPWHESLHDHMDLLTGKKLSFHGYDRFEKEGIRDAENPFAPYNVTEKTALQFVNWDKKPFSGRFVGGCLDILANLCGTRFDHVKEFNEKYQDNGIIFFLEACDLNVFSIRRALWELKEAGWFTSAKAFLIGRPLFAYDEDLMGLDRRSAVMGILDELKVPVILDADIGHLPPMIPMINGGYGTVSVYQDNNIRIDYELK